jgi:hypothetical protein
VALVEMKYAWEGTVENGQIFQASASPSLSSGTVKRATMPGPAPREMSNEFDPGEGRVEWIERGGFGCGCGLSRCGGEGRRARRL